MRSQRVGHDWATFTFVHDLSCLHYLPWIFFEGDGTPLQYSCLENPMDRGAWWAAVHGVAEGRTQLSDLLSLFTFMHWRREWQPTPVFWPGESQGWGAWWAAVYGVAQSWTWLKRLSSSSSSNTKSIGICHLESMIVNILLYLPSVHLSFWCISDWVADIGTFHS